MTLTREGVETDFQEPKEDIGQLKWWKMKSMNQNAYKLKKPVT